MGGLSSGMMSIRRTTWSNLKGGPHMNPETINVLSQMIATVGFPIAAFAAIFYLYDKTIKELTVTITKIDSTLEHILKHLEIESAPQEVK